MTFLPYKKQIGDLKFTNFYLDDDGIPKPLQSHLEKIPFSFFEIVHIQPNHYYGTEDQYEWDGDYALSFIGEPVGYVRTHKSCFVNPTTNLVLAWWKDIKEDGSNIEFIGSRPFELDEKGQRDFWELAKWGQQYIEGTLPVFIN